MINKHFMATIHHFQDLEVWQLARSLENKVFALTNPATFHNDFDLIRQMRRSSGSVMDNIAEGFGRGGKFEFVNSLSIAKGEVAEIQSQLFRSADRQYIANDIREAIHEEAERLAIKIGSFMHYLNSTDHKGQKFQNRNTTPNS